MKLTRQAVRNSIAVDQNKGIKVAELFNQTFSQYLYKDCRVLHVTDGVEIQIGISHNDRDFVRVIYYFLKENGYGK